MGIKRKSSGIYVTGRGIEMEVSEMETEHLVNAIAHHKKQLEALEYMLSGDEKIDGFLQKRIEALCQTMSMLAEELAKRDPSNDFMEEEDRRANSFRSYSEY